MADVSIVVRFRNEAFYLEAVLRALRQQTFASFEIICVDNVSTDNSATIAAKYSDKLLSTTDYYPGKALNHAISNCTGANIVALSAHAIPANRSWLSHLHSAINVDGFVAGAYGAQQYQIESRFLDKRDLDIFSSTEPRIEYGDSDFWNANSILRRSLWERQPFDETVFELEDHYWTKLLLPQGYHILFEPRALVYHYGHIQRIDREHLPPSDKTEENRIAEAVRVLKAREVDWPAAMRAGLLLSSLTHSPHIWQAIDPLGHTLLNHWDFDVRWRMAQALGKIQDPRSADYLIGALSDPSFYPRDEAAWSLARLGAGGVSRLLPRLREFERPYMPFVALALGASGVHKAERYAIEILLTEIMSDDPERQRNASYVAGEIVHASTSELLLDPLHSLLKTDNHELLRICVWALGCFAAKAGVSINLDKLTAISRDHPDMMARYEATCALGKWAFVSVSVLQRVIDRLTDSESRVRFCAMQSLRRLRQAGMALSVGGWQDDDFGVMFKYQWIEKLEHA